MVTRAAANPIAGIGGALLVLLLLPSCLGDHFFRATGRVVNCGTVVPVPAATIHVHVDKGGAPGPYSGVFMTSSAGQFDVEVADYSNAWITFTFQKTGFDPLVTQIQGYTKVPLELCMTPAATP